MAATIYSKQVIYEAARVTSLSGWWIWASMVLAIAMLLVISVRYYRRDVAEQTRPVRFSLIWLRVLTIFALIFFFFDLVRRTQRVVTRPSEVAVLVDTSQSMSLPSDATGRSESRIERVRTWFDSTPWLDELFQGHRVSVYTFGASPNPNLVSVNFDAQSGERDPSDDRQSPGDFGVTGTARGFAVLGVLLIVAGILAAFISLFTGAASRATPAASRRVAPWIAAAAILLPAGIGTLGGVATLRSDRALGELVLGGATRTDSAGGSTGSEADAPNRNASETGDAEVGDPVVKDWEQVLEAAAAESRIGDAIEATLARHDPATLAGIVVVTDGQGNGGTDVNAAIAASRRAEVALVPVGLGSNTSPTNVRLVDLDAPRRVYPGDRFAITAIVQGSGSAPMDVEVQLLDELDSGASDAERLPEQMIETRQVKIPADGTLKSIRFEMEPEQVGRRRLAIKLVPKADDQNDRDNSRDARYEVVARKLRVLALAGGPTREYRFVRNLLHRDPSIELDVLLQTGVKGISQDAARVLTTLPASAEEWFEYDAVILFDPDWTAIDLATIDLLDRYVASQSGGLILIAGPVYHPQWVRSRTDPRVPKIASFYPVTLSTGSPLAVAGRQGGSQPWPLDLTPEASRAEFLWIDEQPQSSLEAWQQFSGVYDYVSVKQAKPGAKVYAYFSDPTTELGGTLPVFLASQFYGSGRTFFIASGELWRLRGEDEAYFDRFYTKLVRWVSEGRLLRDSNRGVFLVDNARAMVGDTINLRAVLTNDQFEPLDEPEVSVRVLAPVGAPGKRELTLRPLEGEPRPGTYGGQYTVRKEGSYEFLLAIGDALNEEELRQTVQVRLPTVEQERPRRNDELLTKMAKSTGGSLFVLDRPADIAWTKQVNDSIVPQPQTTVLPGTPDIDFSTRRNATLMCLIATMLSMEWVVRRLHKLA
ncbi:MAG: vWA domain-containing protein [Planctomycetota bacterium]